MKVLLLSLSLASPVLLAQTAPAIPFEVDGAPVASGTEGSRPAGSDGQTGAPGGVAGAPGGVAGTPGDVAGTPGGVADTPGSVVGTTGDVSAPPGGVADGSTEIPLDTEAAMTVGNDEAAMAGTGPTSTAATASGTGGAAAASPATSAELLEELEALREEVELLRATADATARQSQESRELEEARRLSLGARQDAFLTTLERARLDLNAASESLHEGSFEAEAELEVAVERLSAWTDHPDAVTALESIQLAQAAISSRNFLEAETRVAFARTVLERALRETGRRDALPPPPP